LPILRRFADWRSKSLYSYSLSRQKHHSGIAMIPVNITVSSTHDVELNDRLAGEVLDRLRDFLREEGFESSLQSGEGDISSSIKNTLTVAASARESHFIRVFLSVLQKVMRFYSGIILSIEFEGNRINLDAFSIDRAEFELRKLTEGSFNISGDNVVIGSANTISPSVSWPRKK
jgi:hypothetical protein